MVRRRVAVRFGFGGPGTRIEGAVKGFYLVDPDFESMLAGDKRVCKGKRHTLEVALFALGVAGKSGLRLLLLELVENLAVRDVTDLVVFIDDQALAITDTALAFGHHGVTSVVCLAHIAVYTLPTFIALAVVALTRQSVVSFGQ